ncbi:MAG: GTP-binding protein [Pseudomonadota bacterium]
MSTTPVIIVTGFLGAGKTTLVEHLQKVHSEDLAEVVEIGGLETPATYLAAVSEDPARHVQCVISVADAANFSATLADPLTGALITAQITMADAVIVTRSDATSPDPTLQDLSALTECPILVAPHGKIDMADVPAYSGRTGATVDLNPEFETWEYTGPATLKPEQAEMLLEQRPKGIYRVTGQVRTDKRGLDLQLIGRVRQITQIAPPAETQLRASGPKSKFNRNEMDQTFSEYVAASTHLRGIFGHR